MIEINTLSFSTNDFKILINKDQNSITIEPDIRSVAFILVKVVLCDYHWSILPGGKFQIGSFQLNGLGKDSTLRWLKPDPPKEFIELEKCFDIFIKNLIIFM